MKKKMKLNHEGCINGRYDTSACQISQILYSQGLRKSYAYGKQRNLDDTSNKVTAE